MSFVFDFITFNQTYLSAYYEKKQAVKQSASLKVSDFSTQKFLYLPE